MCVPYEQQQQHHVGVVADAGDVQGRPQVFVLVVHVQASLDQELRRKHVVMAGALQNRSIVRVLSTGNRHAANNYLNAVVPP